MDNKIVLLTGGNIASVEALAKVLTENTAAAAAEILVIITDSNETNEKLEDMRKTSMQLEETVDAKDVAIKNATDLFNSLKSDFDKQSADYKKVVAEKIKLDKYVGELMEEFDKATDQKPGQDPDEFTYAGDKYGFKFKAVRMGSKIVTAADVIADADLKAHLVKRKSGMIYKKE